MNDLRKLFSRLSLDIVIFSLPIFAFVYVFPKLIGVFIPLILGFIIYLLAKPINKFLLDNHFFPSLAALLSILLIATILGSLLWVLLTTVLYELRGMTINYSDFPEKLRIITNRITFLNRFASTLKAQLFNFIVQAVKSIFEYAKNLPFLVITAFSSIFISFFLLKDTSVISNFFIIVFGRSFYKKVLFFKQKVCSALFSYIKAQLLIELIIFTVLFIGFTVLEIPYSLIFSIIVVIVDAIPILGTGTILIPWAILCIMSENIALAWGLLALYGVCLITRQIIEPKIIGSRFGIHPIASILSIYIGMKLFGVLGLFFGPLTALFVKSLLKWQDTD